MTFFSDIPHKNLQKIDVKKTGVNIDPSKLPNLENKEEILGKFRSGGISSSLSYLEYLKE